MCRTAGGALCWCEPPRRSIAGTAAAAASKLRLILIHFQHHQCAAHTPQSLTCIAKDQLRRAERAGHVQQEMVNPEVAVIPKPDKPGEGVVLNRPNCTMYNFEGRGCLNAIWWRVWGIDIDDIKHQLIPMLLLLFQGPVSALL
jgi:hypothetical protein